MPGSLREGLPGGRRLARLAENMSLGPYPRHSIYRLLRTKQVVGLALQVAPDPCPFGLHIRK